MVDVGQDTRPMLGAASLCRGVVSKRAPVAYPAR
jgi:hypothetical protein